MADPRTVSIRRQNADARLKAATESAAKRFGVQFVQPRTPQHRAADLHAVELIENVADFLEQISSGKAERKAS